MELAGKLYDAVSGKVEVVHVDEEAGAVGAKLLFGILQQEGGLAHATSSLDADKAVVPVNLIHEVAPDGSVRVLYKISVCAIKCFHAVRLLRFSVAVQIVCSHRELK